MNGINYINSEDEQQTTWLHPKTGQPVSVMIIPPLEGNLTNFNQNYIYHIN